MTGPPRGSFWPPAASGGWAAFALAGASGLAGVVVLHFWVPAEGAGSSWCLLNRVFGQPCPGCGMTRAFAHLAKWEWHAALRSHPLAPVLAAEVGLLWMAWGATLAGLLRLRRPARLELALLGHLAVLVALWLGRLATGTLPP
ncbi:MAG TPA: DUF2752 domain-containing protein [Thermoanaerobaculia bacterium]|nr:DUF2752 domain-containing protein [Thermoanaerobaculia bacterium]